MPAVPLKLVREPAPESLSDEELQQIARRDRDRAFDLLVRKYRERIYCHALYITRDSQEAFDVAQEVFVRAHHEPRLWDDGFRAKAWLFRVCTNRCYNIVRDKHRRGGILERVGKQTDVLQDAHRAVDTVVHGEMSTGIAKAMGELSEEHRTILTLRYYDDLSYQEIAETLSVKLGTVMSRLSRAKARLAELVDEEGNAR